jgi:arabinofuranosyltransferase
MIRVDQVRSYLATGARPAISPRVHFLVGAGLAAIAVLLTLGFWNFNVDDSYIGYRIAENVVSGHGWVYNLGERVNGATSPLWTLVLILGASFGSTILVSHLVTAVCIFLVGYFAWRISWHFLGPWLSFIAGALMQTHPMLILSVSMETWLFLAFALISIWAWYEGRSLLACACLAVVVLARPDGLLLAGLVFALLWTQRRLTWLSVVVFLLPLAAWSLFSVWQFGSPFPHTLEAKMAQGRSGFWSLALPPLSFLPLFLKGLLWWLKHVHGIPLLLLVFPFSIAGLLSFRQWHPILTLVISWGGLHLAAYSLLKVPHYHWYYSPVLLAMVFGSLAGCRRLLDQFRRRRLVCLCIILAGLFFVHRQLEFDYLTYAGFPEPRNAAYERLANWLKENTEPTAKVAAAEIGVVGYISGRPMVDMAGLMHAEGPAELRRHNAGWWMARRTPEIVIAHTPAWQFEAIVESTPGYRVVYEQPPNGYQTLRVFERTGSGALKK